MKLIVYLDLLLLINLIMNYLILWATAKLSDLTYNIWRLLITSLFSTVYTLMIILPKFNFLNRVSIHFLVSIIMLIISFAPLTKRLFLKTIGYFYLITFVTAGVIFAVYNLTGGSPLDTLDQVLNISPDKLWIILLGSLVIVVIGKFGWLLIQSKLIPDIFCIPITIKFDDQSLQLVSLVDTGNQLQDPLTKVPVIIVELGAMIEILPDKLKESFSRYKSDSSQLLSEMIDTSWSSRFRLIPFSTIGKDNGMLVGFRPDEVRIQTEEGIVKTSRVIVALQDGSLDNNNNYQALLNPEVLRSVEN
ncbi:sigma-E processing peptidase SpoIIGA [Natroniella acetigena]|uniref:sigma-E processing peptidase SpoIIGA n=1 Tax=Natroniella acetigena TaxID=52004 RepID=UPI00200AF994|nr:sigma-E processing peptidase SpoIIGA [Natroniella acetigena]MCK8827147.1 sigma-E processing peptidase SpoIIGA [Natroniella acetigena]